MKGTDSPRAKSLHSKQDIYETTTEWRNQIEVQRNTQRMPLSFFLLFPIFTDRIISKDNTLFHSRFFLFSLIVFLFTWTQKKKLVGFYCMRYTFVREKKKQQPFNSSVDHLVWWPPTRIDGSRVHYSHWSDSFFFFSLSGCLKLMGEGVPVSSTLPFAISIKVLPDKSN